MHTLLLCCVLVLVAPIAITASSLVPRGQDGFETTIRRNPNFAVNNLQVTITPGDAQSSVAANGDMFTVTVQVLGLRMVLTTLFQFKLLIP